MLSAPVTMVVNLTDGTITVLATSGFEMATVDTGDVRPVNRNSLFVSTPFDAYQPWKDCSDAVLSSFSALGALGDGTYKGRFYVPYGEFKLRFISELSSKGTPNMVIAPPAGADRALSFVDGVAYSSAALLPADQAGYWTYEIGNDIDIAGKWVEVTVTPGENPSVKFEMPDGNVAAKNEIYLIGDMQGWYISDGSMPLRLTTKGGFYGVFDIPAGYFIVRSGGDMKIGVENFGLLKENMLRLTPAGVYEGEISLDADDAAYVIFAKDCKLATGIYTPYQNTVLTTFDLTAGKSEVSQNAFPARGDSYATSWLVRGASGKTRVAFAPANSRLTIGGEGAGVENVSADSSCGFLSVVPSTGCVVITTSVAASVPVYSVTGMLARLLDLPAGVTTVDLPAGLYVVGSTKVYVR